MQNYRQSPVASRQSRINSMRSSNIEQLNVFKKSHELTMRIYDITNEFPPTEKFGLVTQLRRAAVSINSNLMEGGARNTDGEYRHFVGIARGSTAEIKYQIRVAKDVGFINVETYNEIYNSLEEISKMLVGLIQSISYKHTDDWRLATGD